MVVLIDTNVIIDFISRREPFFNDAKMIIQLCAIGKIKGCIAFHSVADAFYILRKSISADGRKQALRKLCNFVTVVSCSHEKVCDVLDNANVTDVEDALQIECAKVFNASYIITRNISDFADSVVPAILPSDFVELIEDY